MKLEPFAILIVDDDPKIIEVLVTFFKIKYPKFIVVSSNDVREAQLKMDNQDFNLIIVDQFIDNKTGLDLIAHARKTIKHSNRKFIVMSGGLGTTEVAQAINLGITDILVKPFPLKQLEEKVLKFYKN